MGSFVDVVVDVVHRRIILRHRHQHFVLSFRKGLGLLLCFNNTKYPSLVLRSNGIESISDSHRSTKSKCRRSKRRKLLRAEISNGRNWIGNTFTFFYNFSSHSIKPLEKREATWEGNNRSMAIFYMWANIRRAWREREKRIYNLSHFTGSCCCSSLTESVKGKIKESTAKTRMEKFNFE